MIFRKLTANDVEARVQSCDENGFILLLYKNARVDQNILDETFTPFGWQNKYEEFKGNMYCSIGIKAENGEWIWKSNCGTESNTEKEKGEASDSFKRAGFNWGIGRELYTAPKTKIKGHTKKTNRNGKEVWVPEYYAFDVVQMDVSDEMPRRITALTIIGKSMSDGYHEDEIFNWTDKKTPHKKHTVVAQDEDIVEKVDALEEKKIRTAALAKWGEDTPNKIKPILERHGAATVKELKRISVDSVLEMIANAD